MVLSRFKSQSRMDSECRIKNSLFKALHLRLYGLENLLGREIHNLSVRCVLRV